MTSVNRHVIIGRLGQDPEIRYTPSGAAVCQLSVATSDKWKDKTTGEWKEDTEWHRVVLWRNQAEFASEHVRKGDLVYVAGKVKTEKWVDQEGTTKYTTKTVAREFMLLMSKSDDAKIGTTMNKPTSLSDDISDDDIPF